jgi:alginate O-acetyltransferase complex protein AlgI
MLFSSPDYPLFLIAVFVLYAIARRAGWARAAVMLLLGDVIFTLLAKDVGALWDPLGGVLLQLVVRGPFAVTWHWLVGSGVVAGGIALGRRRGTWIASVRGQAWIARGFALALVAVGATVAIATSQGTLAATTTAIAAHAHLVVLAVLGVAIGAAQRDGTRTLGRVIVLFVASSLFYQAWASAMPGPYRYLLAVLVGTIVLDYYLALWIEATEHPLARRVLVIVSLCSNLGILAFFKYTDFFTQDVLHLPVARLNLILPAGISFHTFQSLSYTIDVYRKQLRATRSPVQFATFVLFFPQLVAGPIVRAQDLLPQLGDLPALRLEAATRGVFRIVIGLFKKIALADTLALALVDRVFDPDSTAHFSSVEVLVAVYAYALQIYLDFSAYSDIAIGSAEILGFTLPENFRTPYRSADLQEFWRRWHISLSTWLRDYLYITLGGNRGAPWRTYFNLALTMLLGGLWHGASWTFVVWGALHGLGLAVTRFFQRHVDRARSMVVWCGALAIGGLAIESFGLPASAGTWPRLVLAWLCIAPLWAVATAWLGRAGPARSSSTGVTDVPTHQRNDVGAVQRAAAYRHVTYGVILIVVGLIVTIGTYSSASEGGGAYVIAYGPIVYGFIRLARGLTSLTPVATRPAFAPPPDASSGDGSLHANGVARGVLTDTLRYAMCACGAGLLAALAYAPSWTWLPLAVATWACAAAADLFERGVALDRAWWLAGARRALAVVLVFHYVCLAWIFFRATSFASALAILSRIASCELDHANVVPLVTIAVVVGMLCHFWPDASFRWLRDRFVALPAPAQGALLVACTLVLRQLAHAKLVPFIYFQF